MTKKIEILESDLAPLTEFYLSKWNKLTQEIDGVERILVQLGVNPNLAPAKFELKMFDDDFPRPAITNNQEKFLGYPAKGKWIEKCRYLIGLKGKATATEIINSILVIEPHRIENKKQLVPTISGVLADEVKKENATIVRNENSKGNYEYSLK